MMGGYAMELMYEMMADDYFIEHERERMLASRVWMTRDGREVPVRDMTDGHLLNSIRMMERGGHGCFGEYAEDALEMLAEEAERRGLIGGRG